MYVGGLMILTCAIPSEIRSRFASSTEDGNCACVASTLCSIIVALFSPMFHKTVIYFRFPFVHGETVNSREKRQLGAKERSASHLWKKRGEGFVNCAAKDENENSS
ncbi:hypothetical protein KQX54_007243 [Cotesia glomerata]|uniref:Uncharacterized protein n=1 Tax=Cotesia glomerata TaxID=32391 RepID=A0AAV7IVG2_COTGL|nr:hypothetical protein KQX54_007243 [Cotesia glomerata]